LIGHGHLRRDIPHYTLAQVRGFLDAIHRQESERDAQSLALTAMALRAESRSLEQTLERLQDHAHPPADR
jgi:hypothetical protein